MTAEERISQLERENAALRAENAALREERAILAQQMAQPDEIVSHRPAACVHCQQPLEKVPGRVKERRQVHDLPAVRVVVQEHQVEEVWCPVCQGRNEGSFPSGVEAPVQYGPNVRALGVYLHQYQLVPVARSCELLE